MKNATKILLVLLVILTLGLNAQNTFAAETDQPVVHAVLFFSPSCGHCEKFINEDLPQIKAQFPDQVVVIGIDISTAQGAARYEEFIAEWQVADTQRGVPALVVSDQFYVGGLDIPAEFPKMIESGLQTGGIDWPDIPGMADILVAVEDQLAGDQVQAVPVVNLTMMDRFQQDLTGNILAVVVLVAMVFSVIWVLVAVVRAKPELPTRWYAVIPILSILGIFVAAYLSFVEVTGTEAVCGPVGNCNAVQESQYAKLYGVLPVGILGLLGYVGILAAWLVGKYGPENWRDLTYLGVWGMSFFGVLFSIYLTFLEPFVIGATCMWCISSAIIISLQFWLSTGSFQQSKFLADVLDESDWDDAEIPDDDFDDQPSEQES